MLSSSGHRWHRLAIERRISLRNKRRGNIEDRNVLLGAKEPFKRRIESCEIDNQEDGQLRLTNSNHRPNIGPIIIHPGDLITVGGEPKNRASALSMSIEAPRSILR